MYVPTVLTAPATSAVRPSCIHSRCRPSCTFRLAITAVVVPAVRSYRPNRLNRLRCTFCPLFIVVAVPAARSCPPDTHCRHALRSPYQPLRPRFTFVPRISRGRPVLHPSPYQPLPSPFYVRTRISRCRPRFTFVPYQPWPSPFYVRPRISRCRPRFTFVPYQPWPSPFYVRPRISRCRPHFTFVPVSAVAVPVLRSSRISRGRPRFTSVPVSAVAVPVLRSSPYQPLPSQFYVCPRIIRPAVLTASASCAVTCSTVTPWGEFSCTMPAYGAPVNWGGLSFTSVTVMLTVVYTGLCTVDCACKSHKAKTGLEIKNEVLSPLVTENKKFAIWYVLRLQLRRQFWNRRQFGDCLKTSGCQSNHFGRIGDSIGRHFEPCRSSGKNWLERPFKITPSPILSWLPRES